MKLEIKLQTIQDVKDFVNIANQHNTDVTVQGGRYVVDGKSIMGLFSLDLMESLIVEAYDEPFINDIKKFVK